LAEEAMLMGLFEPGDEGEAPEEPEPLVKTGGLSLECADSKRTVTAGTLEEYHLVLRNDSGSPEHVQIRLDLVYPHTEEGAADWTVIVEGLGGDEWDVTATETREREIEIDAGATWEFDILVTAPRGATYGDQLNILATAVSTRDQAMTDSVALTTVTRQAILAVKTTIGHEKSVANSLASRATQKKDAGVYSVLSPYALRGYVIVESMSPDRLEEIVRGIRRARGIVRGETSFDEIVAYLTPKPLVHGIVEGDIVELVAGPFKGEKARVQSIDESKEEITVELFEAMVPIPVTIKGDHVRVIEKEAA
jgi:transcriptional antiterminator NusG